MNSKGSSSRRDSRPPTHFARQLREDPKRRGLLYLGTEHGMYVSFDDGQNWERMQGTPYSVLPKPFDIAELVTHVRACIAAQQTQAAPNP